MEITWFGHACVRVLSFGHTIMFDPVRANSRLQTTFKPDSEPKASLVLISNEKGDHCEPDTVDFAAAQKASIVAPRASMKGLLRARRRDLQYAIAKPGELFDVSDHVRVRCLSNIEPFDKGITYVLEAAETVLFLGDALMTAEAWAYAGVENRPNVVVYPPYLVRNVREVGEKFRTWIASLGNVSCIPIHYHSSPHGDPVYFIPQDDLPATLPPGARLELLSNRPLVAKETRRMRRRM